MTELETQLLRIIEEQQQQLLQQQTQLQQQQQSLEMMQKKIIHALSTQSQTIKSNQDGLQQVQRSLAEIQKQFYELDKNTASYINQINGKVTEMSQITTNNANSLKTISNLQASVSSEVEQAQQNLLKTSQILQKVLER